MLCARLGTVASLLGWLLAALLGLQAGAARGEDVTAAQLRRLHAELAPALARSDFGRPMLLQSEHGRGHGEGVVHAVLDAPMARVQALVQPQRWCEVLMLHQNTRGCQVAGQGLQVEVGGKRGALGEGVMLALRFESAQQGDLLKLRLSAEHGPLGTRDYDFSVQATALPDGRSFLRFRYSYGFGLMARVAMQSYLSTWGQQKVGFSREARPDGQPGELVRGMRGVIERNTMRYFLGIETVLRTLEAGPDPWERRLQMWFDATEQYARQLHELERQDYLALKRRQLGLQTPSS